jgi:hypothetical protein
MEGHHPITCKEEVAVDIKIAALIVGNLYTKCVLHILLVQIVADPSKLSVAEIALIGTLATDIVDILASALVWANHGIVAVDGSRNAAPGGFRIIARLNE